MQSRSFFALQPCPHDADSEAAFRLLASAALGQQVRVGLGRVRRGDTIVVTDRSEPVAELRPIAAGRDPAGAALAKLAATGGLTLPTRKTLVRIGAARLTRGSASAVVAADRDQRG